MKGSVPQQVLETARLPAPPPTVVDLTAEFRLGYRSSLDGLRGVSILLVVAVAVHCHMVRHLFGFIGLQPVSISPTCATLLSRDVPEIPSSDTGQNCLQ
jgi:hypothetical protein